MFYMDPFQDKPTPQWFLIGPSDESDAVPGKSHSDDLNLYKQAVFIDC